MKKSRKKAYSLSSYKYSFFLFIALSFYQYSNASEKEFYFEQAYVNLCNMLSDKSTLNFKKAVFIVENAFYDEKLNESRFDEVISEYGKLCAKLATSNLIQYTLEDATSVYRNAAIFKFMSDTITVYLDDNNVIFHFPFKYNFDDYAGKADWRNTFVTTLLDTHKGNCHSLPILYKLIAEEMGEKAWLWLAPNHFYIKLRNKQSGWYNTELTSGNFPSDVWMKSSGYIHLDAIINGIYMDTLSMRNSVALCLVDLAQGYQHKYPDSYEPEFVLKCCDTALEYFPNYINALLLKVETLLEVYCKNEVKSKNTLRDIEDLYGYIHKLGYRKMPDKMYLEWLSSIKDARGAYQFKSQ
jgi:hypothetical protein